jgi:hypothetical protein
MANKKPLFQKQGAWATGLATRPVFIDGLTHSLFYLIVGCKNSADSYQAVVVGRFAPDVFKIKFYGKFEDFGFTKSSISDKFGGSCFLDRSDKDDAGYQRYYTNRDGLAKILKALGETRGVTVAPLEQVLDAYNMPQPERAKIANQVHPARGGHRPTLPFKPVPVLQHA